MWLANLRSDHARRDFKSGESAVDSWLATRALQHQTKHLSANLVKIDFQADLTVLEPFQYTAKAAATV